MILLIFGFIFLMCGLILFYKTNQIKIVKNLEQQNYKNDLYKEIDKLTEQKNTLIKQRITRQEQLNNDLLEWQQQRKKQIELYLKDQRALANQAVEKNNKLAQRAISEINTDLNNFKQVSNQQKATIQKQLDNLKSSLNAGIQARLREQEKNKQINFYKLQIEEEDLLDIQRLNQLKLNFHKPVVLSKLIWTQYFQKQMTELCDRVLGKNVVCGIYKITNTISNQCYIGQSVNISDRWKQHCKCGLGIQASATNKLYNAMQKDGVWNFTFELLEVCSKELLNEKESFWIQMYQSNTFGYNITKGNKI